MRVSYLDYEMSVIAVGGPADVETGSSMSSPDPLRDGERGLSATSSLPASARRSWRGDGQVPPARRTAPVRRHSRLARTSDAYPLVDGQGNFGSVDGDTAARCAYTEARLTGDRQARCSPTIDKDTVDSSKNTTAPRSSRPSAGQAAEPAGQRQSGIARRKGHQHPAAPPRGSWGGGDATIGLNRRPRPDLGTHVRV